VEDQLNSPIQPLIKMADRSGFRKQLVEAVGIRIDQ